MPLIDDRPKVKVPVYKIEKRYVRDWIDYTKTFYSFLPDCKDVKEVDYEINVRIFEISEPSFVGNFITQREFQFCEHFKKTVLKFGTGTFADYVTAEQVLKNDNCKGRFYKAKQKQVKQ
jgi:hypothetical protein